jgi:transcriptional regulator with XRE-family HTH domain
MFSRESFGEYIRSLRETKLLPLRKVAAVLDIDPSTLGKIERGERMANRDFIPLLSSLFEISIEDLTLIYLSDKVANELISEANSNEILQAAEFKIKYLRAKNIKQESLKF